jgi:hypothetical protein
MAIIECRHCHKVLSAEEERSGARCPRCREPLYERSAQQQRSYEAAQAETARCGTHPNNPSVGTCQRCGNFVCAVCRTRWYDRALCLACVERNLEAKQAGPEDARAHRRQAMLALILGVAAWGLVMLGALPLLLARPNSPGAAGFVTLAGLVTLCSVLPSLFGIGQGAAAIRARGERMLLATCGLVLCGTHLGVFLGLPLFAAFAT